MNTDQLMDSLSANDPNEGTVLGLVYRKRRVARQRMYAASGGLAVVAVAVVAGVLLQGVNLGGGSASSSSSALAGGAAAPAAGASAAVPGATPGFNAAPANPNAQNGAAGSGSSSSCAAGSLQSQLTQAVRQGASVIVGFATAGTASATGSPGGAVYQQVTLRSVQNLAGPTIGSGSTAWVQVGTVTSSGGTSVSPEGQSIWAPDGEFFGIVTPAAKSGAPGPGLRVAPVIGGQVILSPDECWNITGVPARPYHGPVATVLGPERSVPASSGATSSGTVPRDLYAVPLADAEKAVPRG